MTRELLPAALRGDAAPDAKTTRSERPFDHTIPRLGSISNMSVNHPTTGRKIMKDGKLTYVCNVCGESHPKWGGQCSACKGWNTLEEAASLPKTKAGRKATPGSVKLVRAGTIKEGSFPRISTTIGEFDRVLGGGFVPGSAILIGGDPGIGKSTLLLQVTSLLALGGKRVAYISGEENEHQLQGRANRLGHGNTPLEMAHERDAGAIVGMIQSGHFDLVIVDSIQTVFYPQLDAVPGSVSQVKSCANDLVSAAKQSDTALVLVGHVTKDGSLAGPKTIEHLVDAVISFATEQTQRFRILRASKNRFGSAEEIGVFEMTGAGLQEVPNPAGIFIADRQKGLSGSVVFPGMEGSRPLLLEIQALVSSNPMGSPRRVSIGFDNQRLAMILAVIEKRLGFKLSDQDVFLNVAGGYKVQEPAADLAVACAVLSSLTDTPFEEEAVVMGEIGLGGEVRPIPQIEQRLREAEKLGFPQAFVPGGSPRTVGKAARVRQLADLVKLFKGKPNSLMAA